MYMGNQRTKYENDNMAYTVAVAGKGAPAKQLWLILIDYLVEKTYTGLGGRC